MIYTHHVSVGIYWYFSDENEFLSNIYKACVSSLNSISETTINKCHKSALIGFELSRTAPSGKQKVCVCYCAMSVLIVFNVLDSSFHALEYIMFYNPID